MSSIPACQLNCLNGGYCTFISSDEPTLVDTFARGGLIQKCICTPGYSGISCENKVEECSTDMKCHNGLPCALDEKTGKHYCDCSYADLISTFAGKMCREPATSYCGQGDIKNRSFCTNGGLCEANIYRGVHLDESSNYSTWVWEYCIIFQVYCLCSSILNLCHSFVSISVTKDVVVHQNLKASIVNS